MSELYIPDRSLPRAFICDIDGTLSDHEGIRGHFEYEKVSQDKPIWPIIHIVQAIAGSENWVPIYVSGREEFSRQDTKDWILSYLGLRADNLFMRPNGDYRKDYIIKKEIFYRDISTNYWVEFALDDRDQVVNMWRDIGLPCLQVAAGEF